MRRRHAADLMQTLRIFALAQRLIDERARSPRHLQPLALRRRRAEDRGALVELCCSPKNARTQAAVAQADEKDALFAAEPPESQPFDFRVNANSIDEKHFDCKRRKAA